MSSEGVEGTAAAAARAVPSAGIWRRRAWRAALVLVLIWAAAARMWFGWVEPNSQRFWDERYGLENIRGVLAGAGFQPQNGFHPSLSYLPQLAVLAASQRLAEAGGWSGLEVIGPGGFTPTGYRICRATQAIFGVLGLLLLHAVGRRLFDEPTALLAVILLAGMPWHVRQSAIYKPDILLMATVLLAFLAALRAVERPGLRRFLLAGGAVGLALASKFNAGPIAIPLMVGAGVLAWRGRQWRPLAWLVAAGATAAAVFLALNPYLLVAPEIYRRDFSRTLRDYARKGQWHAGGSRWYQPVHFVESMLGPHYLGRFLGAAGVLGLPLLAWRNRRKNREGSAAGDATRRLGRWMLLAYVAGYVLLYMLATNNPSAHNWLPLAPFLALSAAWLLLAAARTLRERFATPLLRPLPAAVGLLAAGSMIWAGSAYTYSELVPSTAAAAGNALRFEIPSVSDRLLLTEVAVPSPQLRRGDARQAQVVVDSLERAAPALLAGVDAELFPAVRLDAPETRDFYAARVRAAATGRLLRLTPRPFRLRGEELVLLVDPFVPGQSWQRAAWEPVAPGRYRMHLADEVGPWISVHTLLPSRVRARGVRLSTAAGSVDCFEQAAARRQWSWLCPRMRRAGELELEVQGVAAAALAAGLDGHIASWLPPGSPPPRRNGERLATGG